MGNLDTSFMECEICKKEISVLDWLASPEGKSMCKECRKIYRGEEEKTKNEMYERIAKRLEERKKE